MATFKIDRNKTSEIPKENLSVDFLKSANEKLVEENKALIKENQELKSKIKKEHNSSIDNISLIMNKLKEYEIEIEKLKNENEDLKTKALINPRKITDEQVIKIKELRASGLSYRAIVKEMGLSTCTIQRALKGIYD